MSVKYIVGSVPVVVILECRDRQGNEDVTWIEQLASKRDDVNAAKAVAVSSSGFSESAKIKAKHHGVELRVVEELTATEVRGWFGADRVYETKHRAIIPYVHLTIDPPYEPYGTLLVMDTSDETYLRLPFLTATATGDRESLADVWNQAIVEHKLFENVPLDGTHEKIEVVMNYDDPEYRYEIASESARHVVLRIMFDAELWNEHREHEFSRVYAYASPDGRHSSSVEYRHQLKNLTAVFTIHRRESDGQMVLTVRAESPGA